jgi:hypothetical protein
MFIIFIILCYMLYYLTTAIQSLIQEIKEIKTKCVHSNNTRIEDFKVNTPDPAELMTKKAIQTLVNLKEMFTEKLSF